MFNNTKATKSSNTQSDSLLAIRPRKESCFACITRTSSQPGSCLSTIFWQVSSNSYRNYERKIALILKYRGLRYDTTNTLATMAVQVGTLFLPRIVGQWQTFLFWQFLLPKQQKRD